MLKGTHPVLFHECRKIIWCEGSAIITSLLWLMHNTFIFDRGSDRSFSSLHIFSWFRCLLLVLQNRIHPLRYVLLLSAFSPKSSKLLKTNETSPEWILCNSPFLYFYKLLNIMLTHDYKQSRALRWLSCLYWPKRYN